MTTLQRGLLAVVWLTVTVLLGAQSQPRAGGQQNPYRLKDPDLTKTCLACHTDFEQTLKKPVVHAAVQLGECSGCHDPHASSHTKLLTGDVRGLCAGCHDEVIPQNAVSTHKVVADGACRDCHDPHASDNAALLVKKGEDLCFGCHEDIQQVVTMATFKHDAVQQGCVTCHDPHGSDQAGHLLKEAGSAVCAQCHAPDKPAFVKRHQNYPVGGASCSSCHDPHGSNQSALLRNNVHAPVATGGCNLCHVGPGSAEPFATKAPGYELCQGCHNDMVNSTMAKSHLHGPLTDQKGCVNCHNPHASNHTSLLKADPPNLCGTCHAATLARNTATAVKHAPVEGGMCVACHSPHSSEGTYLIDQPSATQLCLQCHDYESHSAHPLGEKAVDPRNKNLRVECLSCHRGHGTEFPHMQLAATNLELCTRCHKKFVR